MITAIMFYFIKPCGNSNESIASCGGSGTSAEGWGFTIEGTWKNAR